MDTYKIEEIPQNTRQPNEKNPKKPIASPSEILIAETGIWDIENKDQTKDTTIYKIRTDHNN
jgi:hypothetical protein